MVCEVAEEEKGWLFVFPGGLSYLLVWFQVDGFVCFPQSTYNQLE